MGPASRKNHVFSTIRRAKSRASLPPFPLTDQCVPSTRSYLNKKWMSIERVMGATFSGVYSQAVADSAAGPNVLLRPSSTHRFWISRLFSFSLSLKEYFLIFKENSPSARVFLCFCHPWSEIVSVCVSFNSSESSESPSVCFCLCPVFVCPFFK